MLRGQLYFLKADRLGKQRPIVVISRDSLNTGHSVLTVPFYSQQLQKRVLQPWCALFKAGEGGLRVDCVAKADEVTVVDKFSIDTAKGELGQFDQQQMERLLTAVRWAMEL